MYVTVKGLLGIGFIVCQKKKRKEKPSIRPLQFTLSVPRSLDPSVRPALPCLACHRSRALPPSPAASQVNPGKKEGGRKAQPKESAAAAADRKIFPSFLLQIRSSKGPQLSFFPRLANASPRENPLSPPREMWDSQRGAKGESRVNLPATKKRGGRKKEIPALRADSLLT